MAFDRGDDTNPDVPGCECTMDGHGEMVWCDKCTETELELIEQRFAELRKLGGGQLAMVRRADQRGLW